MRRGTLLGVVAGIGVLSLVVSAVQGLPQVIPSQAALAAMKIEKVRDNLYIITGSSPADPAAFSGGTSAVLVTDTGVVLVDTKLAGWGQALLDRIKTVTDKPVTTIINTHTHADHTGGNEFFGTTVESIVQENTKANMANMNAFKGDNSKFLPRKTFKEKMSFGTGRNEVDLYYFGKGHTGGDAWVVFPAQRAMHAGDMFAGKQQPLVDTANGGSGVAYGETLAKAAATVKDIDTIVTGHTTLMKPADLVEYASFNKDLLTWTRAEMKAGKTVDQAAAEYRIPAKYIGYTINTGSGGIKANIQGIYDELGKK